jgi:hypothetical protein
MDFTYKEAKFSSLYDNKTNSSQPYFEFIFYSFTDIQLQFSSKNIQLQLNFTDDQIQNQDSIKKFTQ